MEFYPDERYRHDNKHNKNNTSQKMECMKLENLMVCPKCHCVVLMKSEKMEYVYCSKCHSNTLMVPLIYVLAIYQNPMNFTNMMPFIQISPVMQGGPGPVIAPIPSNNMMNSQCGATKPQGLPMGVGPELYPFYPMAPIPNNMTGAPFPLNIDPKFSNNSYMNNMYMNPNYMNSNYMNSNYGNPFWVNFTPMDPTYSNPNKYNDPNNSKDENDPKENKVKTPIITKRASELFD